MIERDLVIPNRLGLHARASARFVRLAGEYECAVLLSVGSREVNGKSLLDVLTLAACQGTELRLTTEGSDELPASEALTQLIENKFEEES